MLWWKVSCPITWHTQLTVLCWASLNGSQSVSSAICLCCWVTASLQHRAYSYQWTSACRAFHIKATAHRYCCQSMRQTGVWAPDHYMNPPPPTMPFWRSDQCIVNYFRRVLLLADVRTILLAPCLVCQNTQFANSRCMPKDWDTSISLPTPVWGNAGLLMQNHGRKMLSIRTIFRVEMYRLACPAICCTFITTSGVGISTSGSTTDTWNGMPTVTFRWWHCLWPTDTDEGYFLPDFAHCESKMVAKATSGFSFDPHFRLLVPGFHTRNALPDVCLQVLVN